MFKLLKILAWVLISLALFIGGDQFLLRVPMSAPGVHQVQTFYVDFRSRLFGLFGFDSDESGAQQSIEAVIAANQPKEKKKSAPAQRYLYVDQFGDLQFADSLELVPARYRTVAEPLAE